jgi:pimeloyl-ACP methyl ester carboxylesterase
MASLLRELETGPIIAVGYSMGGAIIQHLWRQHPDQVAGLVLAASNYRARVARHEELVVLPFFATMIGLASAAEIFGHLPKGLIKRFLPKLADQLHEDEARWALDEMRRTSLRTVAETGREMALHDASHWLHEIDVPTTVVCTERDRAIPPSHQREMASLIKDCELLRHDNGHLACISPGFGPVLAAACLGVARRIEESKERY